MIGSQKNGLLKVEDVSPSAEQKKTSQI